MRLRRRQGRCLVSLPSRGILYTLSGQIPMVVAVQVAFDGVGCRIYGAIFPVVGQTS